METYEDESLFRLKCAVVIMGIILLVGMVFVGAYAVKGLLSYSADSGPVHKKSDAAPEPGEIGEKPVDRPGHSGHNPPSVLDAVEKL